MDKKERVMGYVDAMDDLYDAALLISGDSDLIPPINVIHERFQLKRVDGITLSSHVDTQFETLIKGQLNMRALLDLIRHFIIFEKMKQEDLSMDQINY